MRILADYNSAIGALLSELVRIGNDVRRSWRLSEKEISENKKMNSNEWTNIQLKKRMETNDTGDEADQARVQPIQDEVIRSLVFRASKLPKHEEAAKFRVNKIK